MGIADEIAGRVAAHPQVSHVEPIGSRARGTATELSDWDFHVDAEDFGEVAADLPTLVAPFGPLAAQWDPLADRQSYLLIFPGPAKVDLIFDVPRSRNAPWRAGPDTLPVIDTHFWDWALHLISKRHHGFTDRFRGELLQMHTHILAPLGIPDLPLTLEDAAERFIRARARLEARYGFRVPRDLQDVVLPLLHDHYRPSGLPS